MAATISGIPVYEALVSSDGDGMYNISLVDDPAVQTLWQKFNAQQAPREQFFVLADEERRIIRGVVMRADFPMFRRNVDPSTGEIKEYYLVYRADTIRKMAEKYMAEGRQNNVDIMHDGKLVDGVQMVQLFIKDSAAGICPEGFGDDIADGSLFAEFHVINDEVWEKVKDGTFQGFSLAGYFSYWVEHNDTPTPDEFAEIIAAQFHITDMSKIERLKQILRAENVRQDTQTKRPEKFGAVTTDRGPLEWDGDDDLAVEDRVYVVDEDGNRSDAPTGEYTTDNQVIVVEDGVVTEIRDREEPSQEEQEVEARRQRFQNRRQFFERSYEDKMQAIVAAVLATRGEGDWYVEECGDDYAIVRAWEGDGENLYRYAISWNEDGSAAAADPQKVEQEYVPVDGGGASASETETELRSQLDTRTQELNDANAQIATLTAELEAARKRPMARPAHEEVKASAARPEKTGNKQLDRVAEIMSAK